MSRIPENQIVRTISFPTLTRAMNVQEPCQANDGLGEIRFNIPAYLAVLRAIALFREKSQIRPDFKSRQEPDSA